MLKKIFLRKSHLKHILITVFLDTRLLKAKHPRKRFQNFRQSCVLSTDRIEIHQSQPLVWPSGRLYVMLASCDWWNSIRSIEYMIDGNFENVSAGVLFSPESRVSTKTVVTSSYCKYWDLYPYLCFIAVGSSYSEKKINNIRKKENKRNDNAICTV